MAHFLARRGCELQRIGVNECVPPLIVVRSPGNCQRANKQLVQAGVWAAPVGARLGLSVLCMPCPAQFGRQVTSVSRNATGHMHMHFAATERERPCPRHAILVNRRNNASRIPEASPRTSPAGKPGSTPCVMRVVRQEGSCLQVVSCHAVSACCKASRRAQNKERGLSLCGGRLDVSLAGDGSKEARGHDDFGQHGSSRLNGPRDRHGGVLRAGEQRESGFQADLDKAQRTKRLRGRLLLQVRPECVGIPVRLTLQYLPNARQTPSPAERPGWGG